MNGFTPAERLHALLAAAPDGVVMADADGRITALNPAAQRLFGLSSADAVGRSAADLVPERLRAEYAAGATQIAAREQSDPVEVTGLTGDGRELALELSLAVWTEDGERQFAGLVRDVSERRRADAERQRSLEELERSNEELERFAHVASHDLSEPLRTITGFGELLTSRFADALGQDGLDFAQRIVSASRRMRELVDGLFAYASVGSGELDCTDVDMRQVVAAVVESLGQVISERQAEVAVDGDLPVVRCDEWQIRLVFQNLIANAVKFVDDGVPRVAVGARREGADWAFGVRDNGVGIDPRWAERVFEPFYRLHSRDQYPGHGVGLAICARVVERHGGRIWVEPAGDDGGSLFQFTLPAKDASG